MEYVKEYIKTKVDLKNWLAMDAVHYPSQQQGFLKTLKYNLIATPRMDQKYIWAFVKTLRYSEYHMNNHGMWHTIARTYYLWKLRKLAYKTGFQIAPNAVGPGLRLIHWGPINVNENCRIGRNATLYWGVMMGWKGAGLPCPQIGDNAFICSGTKIIGDVHIGDNVTIGQNCVITKDVPSNSLVVAQQPRMIIRDK